MDNKRKHHGGLILFAAILAAAYILNTNPEILQDISERTGLFQYFADDSESEQQNTNVDGDDSEETDAAENRSDMITTDQAILDQGYACSTLTQEEQSVYHQLYEAMIAFSAEVDVDTKDAEVLRKVYDCISADHPEIFWVSGYSYTTYSRLGIVTGMDVTPNYTMTAEEAASLQTQIDTVAAEWLAGISMDATDYEKSKYVFDTIIDHTEYVSDSENNQNILSVFLGQQSVCQGYAEATAYLLHQVGITSSVITGEIPDVGSHAFNLVLLNGEWYYMDTTWGDGSYAVSGAEETRARTNYLYLNITTEQLEKTHVIQSSFEVPVCTAVDDNYYVYEGRYFTYFDSQSVGDVLSTSYTGGDDEISIRFSSKEAYDEAVVYLLEESGYYYYIPLNRISAMRDDENYVITFVV